MVFQTVNELQLYYEWHGDPDTAETVVFVNGLTSDTTSWHAHLPLFTPRYRVLLYDCRGQGQSEKPDDPYLTRQHGDDLHELLKGLGVTKANVVGLSNGGATSMYLAAAHPEMVEKLVLTSTFAHTDTILAAKVTSWLKALEVGGAGLRFDIALPWVWSGTFLDQYADAMLALRDHAAAHPVHAVRNLIHGCMTHDARALLPSIVAPTLVICGDEDVLTPLSYSRAIAAAIPDARLEIIEGAAHGAFLEKVGLFAEMVLGFLG